MKDFWKNWLVCCTKLFGPTSVLWRSVEYFLYEVMVNDYHPHLTWGKLPFRSYACKKSKNAKQIRLVIFLCRKISQFILKFTYVFPCDASTITWGFPPGPSLIDRDILHCQIDQRLEFISGFILDSHPRGCSQQNKNLSSVVFGCILKVHYRGEMIISATPYRKLW